MNDIIFISVIIIFCILWIYDTWIKEIINNKRKPKFRADIYGWAEYYSPHFRCWRPFYIWSVFNKERIINICDCIKNLKYDFKYIGQGRERIDYDIQRKLWNHFKTAKEVDKYQIELIDRENDYFREVLKNGS